jgi:hypothetical protein
LIQGKEDGALKKDTISGGIFGGKINDTKKEGTSAMFGGLSLGGGDA